MVTAFDLFPIVFFALHLKIYDPGDRKTIRTTSNESEGTGLIHQSRLKVMIVPISNRSTGIISGPISGKRTANFNLNVSDHLLKFIWLLTISGVPTVARFWSMTLMMTLLTVMRVIVTLSVLHIYPILMAGFLIKHIF